MTPNFGHTGNYHDDGPTVALWQDYARSLKSLMAQRATTNRILGEYERAVDSVGTKLTGQKRRLEASRKDLSRSVTASLKCFYAIEDAIDVGAG